MKLTKAFRGVPSGKIYPVQYEVGDECPPELEAAATEQGALAQDLEPAPAPAPAPEQEQEQEQESAADDSPKAKNKAKKAANANPDN